MRKKLFIGLLASLIIYLGLAFWSVVTFRKMTESFEQLETLSTENEKIKSLSILLRTTDARMHGFLVTGHEDFIMKLPDDFNAADKVIVGLQTYENLHPLEEHLNELNKFRLIRRNTFAEITKVYSGDLPSAAEIKKYRAELNTLTSQMLSILLHLETEVNTLSDIERQTLSALSRRNIFLNFATGIVPLIIAIITGFSIMKTESERRKVQEELEILNKNKDRFISILGHDLKGPATAIKLIAELLLKESENLGPEENKKLKTRLYKATETNLNLLEDILTWARSNSNKLEIKPVKINVRQVSGDVTSVLLETAKQKDIFIENQIGKEINVCADKNMLNMVIRNILQNAIKFTEHGGFVKLFAEIKNDKAEISVQDSGVGIEKQRLKNLFNIGKSTSSKGTEGETGTGLGLILVRELVEKNNGEIRVESEPGKGSVFTVVLPLA